jgi:hypothetical protein
MVLIGIAMAFGMGFQWLSKLSNSSCLEFSLEEETDF